MKFLYKPFGIIIGLLSGILARQVASQIWGYVDDREPPKATTRDTTWGKLLAAVTIQSVTLGITRAVVNRTGAKGYHWLTGVWPGELEPEQE